jgi:hypothetical protein
MEDGGACCDRVLHDTVTIVWVPVSVSGSGGNMIINAMRRACHKERIRELGQVFPRTFSKQWSDKETKTQFHHTDIFNLCNGTKDDTCCIVGGKLHGHPHPHLAGFGCPRVLTERRPSSVHGF